MAMASVGENFNIGRVISRTTDIAGRNFVPFFAVAFLFAGVPGLVLNILMPTDPLALQQSPGWYGLTVAIGVLVGVASGAVVQGALTRASIDDLTGKGVQIGSAISSAIPLILPLVGLGILVGLGVLLGFVALIIPGIFLALCWSVASPALVAERLGITAAMSRSMQLTENHRWAILGVGVLFGIVYMIIMAIVAAVGITTGTIGEAPGLVILLIATLVTTALSVISTALAVSIYFELRQIKEGVGLTELAKVFS